MKETIYIQGMHCASCEISIEKACESIEGINISHISAKTWTMDIEIHNKKNMSLLYQSIYDCWYQITKHKKDINKEKKLDKQVLIAIAIVGIVAFVFYKLDIQQYLPSSQGRFSLWIAISMGMVASISTCLAMVGSIVIGFSKYLVTSKWTIDQIKTQLLFQAGRIWWFFLLWWLLGLFGQAISPSLMVTTTLTIIVGIVVIRMWLHTLHMIPNITNLGFHLPKRRSKRMLTIKKPVFAPRIGAATFLLPCGFTISMQLIAINTSSFREGWLTMMFFAIGTAPVLFSLWIWSSYIKEKKIRFLHTILWTLIIFFWIFMITNGRRVVWSLRSRIDNQDNNQMISRYERKEIGHNGLYLVPEIITLTAGEDYELIITPSDDGKWCMSSLTIPKISREINVIKKNIPITYKIYNLKKGTYYVVCGNMGMYQWKIIAQ